MLAVLVVGAAILDGSREPPPAPPSALERVATKNDDAAAEAAARMKARSEAAARAADARIAVPGDGNPAAPDPNSSAPAP
ncbi:MAG TPA: hypothetical protein VGX37_05520 [Allosphingosinicella sp.]|nr:hypothetical protein [Allosphingosinicella sp.]